MKAFTDYLDFRVTLLAVGMTLSFGFIHSGDSKLFMPILAWVVAGVVMSPFPGSLLCLLVIVSWLLLWVVAFYAPAQNGRFFTWCSISLWLAVILLILLAGSARPIAQNLWFWLPTLIFTACSWQLMKLFFITKYVE